MPNPITLKQLKYQVYKDYQVNDSRQLKKVSNLAVKLDLRYKKNWQILVKYHEDHEVNNIILLADYIPKKGNSLETINTLLKSLNEDLAAFKKKIESDLVNIRKKDQKFKKILTYL